MKWHPVTIGIVSAPILCNTQSSFLRQPTVVAHDSRREVVWLVQGITITVSGSRATAWLDQSKDNLVWELYPPWLTFFNRTYHTSAPHHHIGNRIMTVFVPLKAGSSPPPTPSFLVPSETPNLHLRKAIKAILKAKRLVVVCGAFSNRRKIQIPSP